jgi:hypothetical protein
LRIYFSRCIDHECVERATFRLGEKSKGRNARARITSTVSLPSRRKQWPMKNETPASTRLSGH